MQNIIEKVAKQGQEEGTFNKTVSVSTTTTILTGSIRITVLNGNYLVIKQIFSEGYKVSKGILKMLE